MHIKSLRAQTPCAMRCKLLVLIGVIYMARRDGCLEAWDIVESTQQAVAVVPVSAAQLTCIEAGPAHAFSLPGNKSWLGIGATTPCL